MKNNKEQTKKPSYLRYLIVNDRIGSRIGAIFFAFWIGQRIYFYRFSLFEFTLYALTWWLITFQFLLFILAYLTRYDAREHANGFIETVFPFVCAAMPFALIMNYPFKPPTHDIVFLKPLALALVIGGTIIVIAGIAYLRRSFSIMTEVRKPVFSGVYRMTRHPMYLGSMMTALGTLIQNFGILNCLIFVTFCICQVYRGTREENKIKKIYPEYHSYTTRIGWFWRLGTRMKR